MKFIKSILLLALFSLILVGPVNAGDFDIVTGLWDGVATSTLVTDGKDTTDTITLTRKVKGRLQYPDRLSFSMRATEATGDTTQLVLALDLSNDGTYWYSYGTLATISSLTGDNTTTVAEKVLKDRNESAVASIADVVTMAQVETWTYAYPDSSDSLQVASTLLSGTNTHAITPTYDSEYPIYKYARVRATKTTDGDTLTVKVYVVKTFY